MICSGLHIDARSSSGSQAFYLYLIKRLRNKRNTFIPSLYAIGKWKLKLKIEI